MTHEEIQAECARITAIVGTAEARVIAHIDGKRPSVAVYAETILRGAQKHFFDGTLPQMLQAAEEWAREFAALRDAPDAEWASWFESRPIVGQVHS